MIYQPPKLQHRGILKPVLERLARQSFQRIPATSSSTRVDWRVERLQHFIKTAQGKLGWNLDRICKELDLGISGSHGARLFKKHAGLGIREYAKRTRLAAATDKLKTTTLSVKEIAADLGYRSQTDLSRQFKQLFCLSPTEFRIAHRLAPRRNKLPYDARFTQDPYQDLSLEAKSGT